MDKCLGAMTVMTMRNNYMNNKTTGRHNVNKLNLDNNINFIKA